MNCLLLLSCAAMSIFLFIPGVATTTQENATTESFDFNSTSSGTFESSAMMSTSMSLDPSNIFTTRPTTDTTTTATTTSTTTTTTTTTTTASGTAINDSTFFSSNFARVAMVIGGLILACALLLLSTLCLLCKVCQLRKQIKTLSNSADLISNCEYWVGTAKRNKSQSEREGAETAVVLLSDLGQTQEEAKTSVEKTDGVKLKGEEKEAGDASLGEKALDGTANGNSSKSKEEANNPQSSDPAAASPDKIPEQPKNGV